VAARAVAALSAEYRVTPAAEPTIPGLLHFMDENRVDVSVVVPVATRPDQVRSINDWAARASSERIVCFGAIHPDVEDLGAEVERIIALGLKGMKIQPNFQQCAPDDPRLYPAYEAAEGKLTVLFHSGQEIVRVDHVYAQPRALAKVKDMFPHLTMVAAHLGGYQMWPEVREHLLGRDLFLETSYCPPDQLGNAETVALIRAHGVHRVLFGSDFPWGHAGRDIERLLSLGLSQEEVEAICWENAQRLLGLALDKADPGK
jgi:hypothetical protein